MEVCTRTRNEISNILRTMNQNDAYAQGAAQQMANGFYRSVDMLNADVDRKRKAILSENDQYNSRINKIDNELTKPR